MRLDLSTWLRTFLNADTGGDAGGAAVADAPATDAIGGDSSETIGYDLFEDAPAEIPEGGDVGATEVADAAEAPVALPAEGPASGAPAETSPLIERAKRYGMTEERAKLYGDNLEFVLADYEQMLVARVTQQQQPAGQPKPQPQTPPAPKPEPQAQQPAAPAGPLNLDDLRKSVAEKLTKKGYDADGAGVFTEAVSEFVQPLVAQLQELHGFHQAFVAEQHQAANVAAYQEFAQQVEAIDPDLFGKGYTVSPNTPQFEARNKVWQYVHSLAAGQRQLGLEPSPASELVQSAYAAIYREKIAKGVRKDLFQKVRRQSPGAKPTQRATHQPHTPTDTQNAIAAVAKLTGESIDQGLPPDLLE